MTIYRYLLREIMLALVAILGVLLLIFLSNQFIRYLARAAAGEVPMHYVFKLIMLEIPNLFGLLLPLALFLAIVLAYGRLYAENEMTVLSASGFSNKQLLATTLGFALGISLFAGIISLYITPSIAAVRTRLLTEGASAAFIDILMPGRFQQFGNGKHIVYVEHVSRDRRYVKQLFAAEEAVPNEKETKIHPGKEWTIITANSGKVINRSALGGRFFVAENGHRYKGIPGSKQNEVTQFDEYGFRLSPPQITVRKKDIRAIPSTQLWPINNSNKAYATELQWRLSIPIMALVLALIAIPLSHLKPKQGKYAKILPAVLILISYANLLFIARNALRHSVLTPLLGIGSLHLCFILLGIILFQLPTLKRKYRSFRLQTPSFA
jgi:lipopolysaccharide export system permease protein